MIDSIEKWQIMYGVSDRAMQDLRLMLGSWGTPELAADEGKSEAAVQSRMRLEAGKRGDIYLARNNVGALQDDEGRWVRYGLANDSKQMNALVKSADWIGVYRRLIVQADVGTYVGQAVSVEAKEEGWTYTGQGREKAQMAWANLWKSYGGIAMFYAGGDEGAFVNLPQY